MRGWLPGWDLPEVPLCNATISVPGGLKAGDTLSPVATVTSADGSPVQGTISTVWTINGVEASSVTWDGNPAQIVLQLSCQGNAQEFRASYDGTLHPHAGPGAGSTEPGLGGVGSVPGPTDPIQGVVGTVVPGVLGILGGLLAGGLGGGTTTPGTPGESNGPDGEGSDGEGPDGEGPDGEGPDGQGPDGEGPDGKGPHGKEGGGHGPRGKEGTASDGKGPDGKGPDGKEAGGPTAPVPGAVPPTTQAAIDKLNYAMNQAVATKNTAMAEAVSNAQADAFDANGNVIPEKYAAAVKAIRDAAGTSADPALNLVDTYGAGATTDMALKAAGDTWLGKKLDEGVGSVVSFGSSTAHHLSQIADALAHPGYFFTGLEAATQKVAPTESQALDSALSDGRYLDALGAGAMKYGKGYMAGYGAVNGVAWTMTKDMAKGMLPIDEVATLLDPNASLADKYAAYQWAQVKVGLLLLPGIGEARGAGVAIDAARAAEAANAAAKGARAVEAASVAGTATRAAEVASTAAKGGEAVEAASAGRAAEVGTAGRTAETGAAQGRAAETATADAGSAASGGAKAGEAADAGSAASGGAKAGEAADAGSAASGGAKAGEAAEAGDAAAHGAGAPKPPPLTPERLDATLSAGQKVDRLAADVLGDKPAPTSLKEGARILRENPELQAAVDDAIGCDGGSGAARMARQAGDLGADAHNLITARKMELQNQAMNNAARRIAEEEAAACKAAGQPVPRRIQTFQATEGNRAYATGANAGTDLDMTFITEHVSSQDANEIVAEEVNKLGFSRDALGTHAYVAKPGTLMDTSETAASPLREAWLRRNLGQINSKSGYVPTYVRPDGTVVVGDHVGGALGSEALPMEQRFGPPLKLAGEDATTSVAEQIGKIDDAIHAIGGPNVSDGAKAAARAIKAGAHFVGPEDALMQAAAAKDPIQATQILHRAGIDSLSDLRARVQP